LNNRFTAKGTKPRESEFVFLIRAIRVIRGFIRHGTADYTDGTDKKEGIVGCASVHFLGLAGLDPDRIARGVERPSVSPWLILFFSYNPRMKFGRIKRQHGRVGGLDAILNRIVRDCPHVSRIVPGRIKVRRGHTPPSFKIQYPTQAGLKCLFTATGTVQEVFLICSDDAAAADWLRGSGIAPDKEEPEVG